MRALIKYDNNKFEGTSALPVSKDAGRTALGALGHFVQMYNVMMEQGNYPPGKQSTPKLKVMLSEMSEIEQLKVMIAELTQDRTASSTKGNDKGANDRKPFQWDNGLGVEVNAKVTAAIRQKFPTMPPRVRQYCKG